MSPIPCPDCGAPLPASPTACPRCHIPLIGPAAARLWQVDRTLAPLHAERAALLATLRRQRDTFTASAPLPPPQPPAAVRTTETAAAAALMQAPFPPAVGEPARSGERRPRWTNQQTLLALGVLLVLVASSIALTFAWDALGRGGQLSIMGALTVLAAVAALGLSRRRLPNSAEALALVSGGMLLLDASAARWLGVLGLDQLDGRLYTALSGFTVACVLALLHRQDPRVAGFAILSLTAASLGWAGVVSTADHSPAGASVLALTGAVLFALAHLVLPPSWGLTRRACTGPAGLWTAAAGLLAFGGALSSAVRRPAPDLEGLACVGVLLMLGGAGAWVTRRVVRARTARWGSRRAVLTAWRQEPWSGDWRALGVVAAVASAAVPSAVLSLALQLGPVGTALLALVAALAGVGLVTLRPVGDGLGARWSEGQAALASAVLALVAFGQGSDSATVVALLSLAVSATTFAVLRPGWRAAASAAAAMSTVAATWFAAGMASSSAQCVALTAVGAALCAFALARPRTPEELGLAVAGSAALAIAPSVAVSADLGPRILGTVLIAVTSVSAAVAALRPRLRSVATAVACVSGTWALWVIGGAVSPSVRWTLLAVVPLGLLAAAAYRRGRPEELVLSCASLLVALAAVADGLTRGWPHAVASACIAYGLATAACSVLPRRRSLVYLAVPFLVVGEWVEANEAGLHTVEVYTLPLAGLLLAAGWWYRLGRQPSSWLAFGPGPVAGLLPSTLLSLDDDGVLRALATVTVAVVLVLVGAHLSWQAPVVLGAIATVVVAVSRLAPLTVSLPSYLPLGVLGTLLLAVGVRYEQRRANARQAVSWLASMS